MDQTILAGLGNIQVTEALFNARIHPWRKGASLTLDECKSLARGIHWTLKRSMKMNSGDEITYVEEGSAEENPFLVYGREGEPCPHCGTILKAIQIGGRTSSFCPKDRPCGRRRNRGPRNDGVDRTPLDSDATTTAGAQASAQHAAGMGRLAVVDGELLAGVNAPPRIHFDPHPCHAQIGVRITAVIQEAQDVATRAIEDARLIEIDQVDAAHRTGSAAGRPR